MIDLAVGVLMGAAFGKIVTSLTNNLISPIIGLLTGGADFNTKYLILKAGKTPGATYANIADAAKDGASIFAYGAFLNDVLNFLIVAIIIFMIVKAYNHLRKKEEAAPAPTPADVVLLTEIRDLLKKS